MRSIQYISLCAIAVIAIAVSMVAGSRLVGLPEKTPTAQSQGQAAPGSPEATRTIDGRYIPAPPAPFGGEINVNAAQSKPYWPEIGRAHV